MERAAIPTRYVAGRGGRLAAATPVTASVHAIVPTTPAAILPIGDHNAASPPILRKRAGEGEGWARDRAQAGLHPKGFGPGRRRLPACFLAAFAQISPNR